MRTHLLAHAVAAALTFGAATAVAGGALPAPDAPGPYGAATSLFEATLTGGRIARVQVFYPTLDPPTCGSTYDILSPDGPYRVSTIHCAVIDGRPAPGEHPLIVFDHGGTVPGADNVRVNQSPQHELLATHGFIVAVAIHSGDAAVRVRDVSLLATLMLARSDDPGDLFHGAIDADRLGLSGGSAGGDTVLGVAAGWTAEGIAPDRRFRAMAIYEPGPVTTVPDAASIQIPYLLHGGTQFNDSPTRMMGLLEATPAATPRIYVQNPGALHRNYDTGLCHLIEETREAALLGDPSLPEPLTTRIAGNGAAVAAWTFWNFGQLQYPSLGPGVGGGRNICTRIGLTSIRSLDTSPADGLTDSPPFKLDDRPFAVAPGIPYDVMVPVVNLHVVAFFKTFLEGDSRYMRFLTPGYAQVHGLPAVVTIVE